MEKKAPGGLREEARNWTCHSFAIRDANGNSATLLRKAADAIEQLGNIEIRDIAYRPPTDPMSIEISISVYFDYGDEL